ncbi:NAD-dependent malic enzyme [Aeromonas rivuli]|jgi:malate dehydrogenase (oxaloacetate-decarboxylating)|uniref:NAD-dependent malic enzyme n=1 Tax=Aeromonas TaxID=642 RepID=UPI0005AA090E|nr:MULTISPECIES: NAD-dependent malic enzyme [Aeromonas]MCS3454604.1 malate dehydrogenase (oxaloacetate-decarboxylating) [Aeromonas sp. BIGb0405]MCS3459533.1 malate dehydrogenase (oxaloacetate-decarboxylating) [Aeromonas sp. BIGb0445]
MATGQYLLWKDAEGNAFRPVSLTGTDLLNNRYLNKSTAFTEQERADFDLDGLLPPQVQTFEAQLERVYQGFQSACSDIEKYQYLRALQDRNETLFYALISLHVEEMTPIIYTPTVGKACQEFSHRFQKARGLYITPQNVEDMGSQARHFDGKGIRIIVVTDSQGILGIGDQGVGGMGIPIGKLSLYTLGAGIHPACCLPIALDVGTDNQALLDDPMYLGQPHRRIRGKEYDDFIDKFVAGVKRHFPNAVLQWEDFSKSNAFNNLACYQQALPSFNDDIQGTGAVVLAGIIGAVKFKGETLGQQNYLVYGAGAGGVGVADQICAGMIREGLDPQAARDRIYILDTQGLVCDNREGLDEYKRRYAKPGLLLAQWDVQGKAGLTEVLRHVPITVLLGTSGAGGAFQEQHIKLMLEHCEHPMVFPLSNPTANCEALPEDIYRWSQGKAIVATGSPFADVEHQGERYRIGQGNNVFIFPGVGLAAIVSQVKEIGADIFTTAAFALAECVSEADLARGTVFPPIRDLRAISVRVATAVLKDIVRRDPTHPLIGQDLEQHILSHMWEPTYLPYRKV